jgi:hypothetical protein
MTSNDEMDESPAARTSSLHDDDDDDDDDDIIDEYASSIDDVSFIFIP